MEIFKKEKKNGCVFTVLQLPKSTDRQTDRQRGREAGLNNYNATDPDKTKENNNNNSIEAVIVGEMKEKKREISIYISVHNSRDNDYDGKEESERDINIIGEFDRKLTSLCD
ncbi:hypothetical protein T07_3983 [Trichinella nelsoni]|uniref:Uncharacterized protein n=1 Tax=Trichinella nelsoni TaxID=6336 RepID=A0A0V0S6Y3_9BILA|nr:hypothetical protein T07_3983 [Trichinella nelsoni]